MNVQAVCFDLDGTLVVDSNLDIAVRNTAKAIADLAPGLDPARLAGINHQVFVEYWREMEEAFVTGTRSGDEISLDVWRHSLGGLGIEEHGLPEKALEIFTGEANASYQLYEDALPVLDALASRMPLVLITNGASDVQRRKLVATGIEPRFAAVRVSGELGTPKPRASIFLRAAELLGIEPGGVLHVGDSLEADVGGAIGAGMTGVWLNRDGRKRTASDPEPHHELDARLSRAAGLRCPVEVVR
jgi:putative hydrolase of the HAD superfamily